MKPKDVVVKTEHEVESILGIKRENDSHSKRTEASCSIHASQPDTSKWMNEKQNLIEKIVALKSQNQQSMFDLKKTQQEAKTLANENRMHAEKLAENGKNHMIQLRTLQAEIANLNATQKKTNDGNLKQIAELIRERDLLRAQFKQLQNGFNRQSAAKEENKSDCDDEQYEVDRLIDDEFIQARQFLVRWKGYDSSHDSWVYEKDLNCPRMVRKYIQSKKIK